MGFYKPTIKKFKYFGKNNSAKFFPGNTFLKVSLYDDLYANFDYRMCIFKDMSNGYSFLTRSCADTKETLKWEDGNEYPLVKLDISMTSHPFYTGKQVLVDTAGRVDKFRTRYNKK